MSPPSRPGGFEGDLEALSVVEIVQTLNLGGRTARVLLRSSSGTGAMWFRDGAMTHATAGSLLGDLAVYEMIEWSAGRFHVAYGLTSESRSIAGDTTHLLLEALRRVDERSSSATADAGHIEVPPVLEADVRRERSRRLALVLTAFVLVAGAIGVAVLRDGASPAATRAVAASVAAPDPAATVAPPAEAPPTIGPAVARPNSKVKGEQAIVAREKPAVALPVPSRVRISGNSGAGGGTLMVLVDGSPVFTHEALDSMAPFETEIAVPPGEHVIVARLRGGAAAGVHEDSARGFFAGGETRLLWVTANRTYGSPVMVKLGRPLS